MRYFRIASGMVRAKIVALISGGNFRFRFPVRLDKGVEISRRQGGRIVMGKHVSVNHNACLAVTENAYLGLGDFVGIGDNNVIVARKYISIGNNTMFGPNVCIYDHDHIFHEEGTIRDLGYNTAPVIIEDNVWLGAGVIVLKGVTIGEGSVVAAGTVVTKDIPKNSVVYSQRELVVKERFNG